MLDPIVQSALVVLVAYLLKLGAEALGIVLDEATLNALAAAIVAYLLGLFGLGLIKRGVRNTGLRGLFREDYD